LGSKLPCRGTSSSRPHFRLQHSQQLTRRMIVNCTPSSKQILNSLPTDRALMATSITAQSIDLFLREMDEASTSGVDVLELRLDRIQGFDTERDLDKIMRHAALPYIVTFRPKWEDPNSTFEGDEAMRLATLKYAAMLGAPFVDVELKSAATFFASAGEVPLTTKIILSSHNFTSTPTPEALKTLAKSMYDAGADIVKIACMANNIVDSASVLSLLKDPIAPTIALAMGEKGQITRLLANKYKGFLTFAAMSPERASAPGQPPVQLLRTLFNFQSQGRDTKLFGIIGSPVSHSRSPLIHNTAFQSLNFDGCYVPLLVDDLSTFLEAFGDPEYGFQGFSVTIPHKEAALRLSDDVDPVAKQIGAVNTLIRQADGKFKGYNTDWSAAISAIERRLASSTGSGSTESPLSGRTFLVLGAGGAGRALAFGAASKGAKVLITNRSRDRAEALVAAMSSYPSAHSAQVVDWEAVQRGEVKADVVANSTSLGMSPKYEETPIPKASIRNFGLVFDSVYTPVETRLLKDAEESGCLVVDGLQMFVGQAAQQFKLFTNKEAPIELMTATLQNAIKK
jgi:3-dehydroquinate dehydratase/shikimate dehydrogenase